MSVIILFLGFTKNHDVRELCPVYLFRNYKKLNFFTFNNELIIYVFKFILILYKFIYFILLH